MEGTVPSSIKPTAIALVVCDNIYSEPGGKTALVGLFNGIAAHKFPVKHPRMAVFASVTDLREGSTAKLEIVHAETDGVVVSAEGPFPEGYSPITVVDMNFIFNNIVFKEEGTYFVRFWANEHLLMMRPVQVNLIKKRGEDKNASSE